MGKHVPLSAPDGHRLSAYRAGPDHGTKALVVIQEIFGVNSHIRAVCDRYAAEGYSVIAPALFDRVSPNLELGYTPDDVQKGRDLRAKVPDEAAMQDIAAAAAALGTASLGVVGYCWGGTLAWWGATRMDKFKAAVGWYGGGIAATAGETPHCPVQLHFGAEDSGIPLTDVDKVRQAQPGIEVYVYEGAQHGFGCDDRGSFDLKSRDKALERTLTFFKDHL